MKYFVFFNFISFLFLLNFSFSNELGNFIHQIDQENPCWVGVTKEEREEVLNVFKGASISCEKVPKQPFIEAWRNLIFSLAKDKFHQKAQCAKEIMTMLRDNEKEENKLLFEWWLNNASSKIAHYLADIEEADKEKRKYSQELKEMDKVENRIDAKKYREKYQELEERLSSIESDIKEAESDLKKIPFLKDPKAIEKIISQVKKELSRNRKFKTKVSDDNSGAPIVQNKDLIEEVEKILSPKNKVSNVLMGELLINFEKGAKMIDRKSNKISETEKEVLWSDGYVHEVIDELFYENNHLGEKLLNCIEGKYGTVSARLNMLENLIELFIGGAISLNPVKIRKALRLKQTLEKLANTSSTQKKMNKRKRYSSLSKDFALNTLGLFGIEYSAEAIYQECIEKKPHLAVIAVPENCDLSNQIKLREFAIKTLELKSCMETIREGVLF